MKKALFLDRDGVINEDKGYVFQWVNFTYCGLAIEALQGLIQIGYKLIIITNQSGIARGYYSEKDYQILTRILINDLKSENIEIDGIYHCPHHPNGKVKEYSTKCKCRKPEAGMIIKAIKDHNIDIEQSVLVGDKESDMEAAIKAGINQRYYITSTEKEIFDKKALKAKNLYSVYEDLLKIQSINNQ